MDCIAEKVKSPHFFIFSDDPEWVSDNFRIEYPTVYIAHNTGAKSHEDMHLMSCCKHNIIANSSFSWWAAWLNLNPDKIVIGPTPAFDKLDIRDADLYPQSWMLIPKS